LNLPAVSGTLPVRPARAVVPAQSGKAKFEGSGGGGRCTDHGGLQSRRATSDNDAMSSLASTAASNSATPPQGKMPNETVRALVTLWLLFHLFGITLALTTNPNYEVANSQLLGAVKSTPVLAQYMYALWLDLPHNYRLTSAEMADLDHSDNIVDLDLVFPDGHREQQQLPPKDARGEEYERYRALVTNLAMPIYNESTDNFLLAKIGEGLLRQTNAKELDVQIRRHAPLNVDDAAASDPGQHDPNNARTYTTVYTGSVTLNSLGQGELHTQGQAARDVAPVTGPRSQGRNRNAMPPAEKAPAPPLPKGLDDVLTPSEKPDSTAPAK
jgi:hypothetical protein